MAPRASCRRSYDIFFISFFFLQLIEFVIFKHFVLWNANPISRHQESSFIMKELHVNSNAHFSTEDQAILVWFTVTRVVQKVLSLIGFFDFSQVYLKMLHCIWMVCWIANDTRLFRANCFPNDRVISNLNRCSHIHWPIYMLHWNMDQKTEIRSYIKCRIRHNIDSKQIFNELCGIYGPQTIQCAQFLGGLKLLKLGNWEDDTRPGRPKTSVTKANIAAVKIVVEQDARLSFKDIASCTGISEGSVQTILKKRLDLRKGFR